MPFCCHFLLSFENDRKINNDDNYFFLLLLVNRSNRRWAKQFCTTIFVIKMSPMSRFLSMSTSRTGKKLAFFQPTVDNRNSRCSQPISRSGICIFLTVYLLTVQGQLEIYWLYSKLYSTSDIILISINSPLTIKNLERWFAVMWIKQLFIWWGNTSLVNK